MPGGAQKTSPAFVPNKMKVKLLGNL